MENQIRQKLHTMIDNFPEERLQEVYNLLNEEEYSDEMKQVLQEEYTDYQKNGEAVSKEEVDDMIRLVLGKNKA